MNKNLVIILAETRAHDLTFPTFKTNLLDYYEADLCLCVAQNEREEENNPFYQNAKYLFQYPEPKDWGDAFDQSSGGKEWRRFLDFMDWPRATLESSWLGGIYKDGRRIPASGGLLLFFRFFLKNNIMKNNLHNIYERFIITRSDYIYPCPAIPLDLLDSKYIWIPTHDDHGGYADKHLVCSSNHILDVLGIIDGVISNSNLLYSSLEKSEPYKNNKNLNLEMFLKFAFHLAGLKDKIARCPFTMYAVREIDGHTSWGRGKYYPEFGFNIKSEKLYKHALLATEIYNKFGKWTPESIDHLRSCINEINPL